MSATYELVIRNRTGLYRSVCYDLYWLFLYYLLQIGWSGCYVFGCINLSGFRKCLRYDLSLLTKRNRQQFSYEYIYVCTRRIYWVNPLIEWRLFGEMAQILDWVKVFRLMSSRKFLFSTSSPLFLKYHVTCFR